MQPKYREEWIVKVGKESFVIDDKQILILREAMKRENRWVSFDKFIISIPHIECIYLSRREIINQLGAGDNQVYTEEDYAIARKKINEIKKNLSRRLSISKTI